MKLKSFIFVAILSIACLSGTTLMAEAPCAHIGHETLQDAVICANQTAQAAYMDSHNQQIMSGLANQNPIPPHPYPAAGYPALMPYMFLFDYKVHGFNNVHLMYPYSMYRYTGSPYSPYVGYPLY